ncbi:adenylyl-sulfate kinase 3-like [Triticum dicoccoides]|uniref:adenylyl-sulfate kinase 3-like n=1 Tax=Triticum dicoccoides TaxID=85692 RepID=UPI00188E2838|nr:adenylyl-sulfate kinase 3-like [Triticum dicoccoides]
MEGERGGRSGITRPTVAGVELGVRARAAAMVAGIGSARRGKRGEEKGRLVASSKDHRRWPGGWRSWSTAAGERISTYTSGKSTPACGLSRELHSRGHLTYILDGDNLRHGLNRDLRFEAKDRAENIRRVGEVAKLFADAGLICIASLVSPYRSERSACRKLLHNSAFIEVFLNVPLEVCEARDPKGLYKLARAGKIKGFTGIDDPYEPPSDCEIVIQCKAGDCATPKSMADQVVPYLEANEFLQD